MGEDYKDINVLEVIEKLEQGADMNFLAKYYKFPSTTILRRVLKKYYQEKLKKPFPEKKPIQEETKEKIIKCYYQGDSIEEISNKFFLNNYHVNIILKEMREKKNYKRFKLNIEDILADLESGYSIEEIAEKNNVCKNTVIYHLKSDERGTKYIPKVKKTKRVVTVEKIEKDYLAGNIDELPWDWRLIMMGEYGPNYIKILKEKKENVSPQKPKKEHHKVLSKRQFETSLKSYALEDLIKEAGNRGIIVPEEYIEEYKSKNNNTNNNLELPNNDEEMEL